MRWYIFLGNKSLLYSIFPAVKFCSFWTVFGILWEMAFMIHGVVNSFFFVFKKAISISTILSRLFRVNSPWRRLYSVTPGRARFGTAFTAPEHKYYGKTTGGECGDLGLPTMTPSRSDICDHCNFNFIRKW